MIKTDVDVEGLVLAGGRSSRFGSDKVAYEVNGVPMIQRVIDAMSTLVAPIRISVDTPERSYHKRIEHITDIYTGRGPMAGLHTGLVHCSAHWLLIVAADLPFITREDLALLLAARPGHGQAVIAREAGGDLQPLCACYRRDVAGIAEDLLKEGRHALHELIRLLRGTSAVDLSQDSLRNINRPDNLSGLDAVDS